MFRKTAAFALLAGALLSPWQIFAQEIHLKSRGAGIASRAQPRTASQARDAASPPAGDGDIAHWIVEFDHAPGAADLAALVDAGVNVTGALPDNAVIGSGQAAEIGANLAGIRWVGAMETVDKLSPELDWSLPQLNVLVEFHGDVAETAQDAVAARHGLTLNRPKILGAGHALLSASGDDLRALAGDDEVAYIFPADPALSTDSDWQACAGMLTLTGKVGQYANIVHGWDVGADKAVHLDYIFGALTTKVPAATVQSEIIRALNEWAKNADIIFQPAASPGAVQTIYIRFISGAHGDGYPFDGPGGTLAHTFYPVPVNPESIAGDMHLDADENWHAGGDLDIYSVALHEAGHALGLGHSDKPGDVMYPYYRRNTALSVNDIGAVQQLYGSSSGAILAPVSSPPIIAPAPAPSAPLTLTPDSTPSNTQAAKITLTGTVSGGSGSIAVQWQSDHGYSGRASVTGGAWTAADIALASGSNAITVSAFDAASHTVSRTVFVTRSQPPATTASAVTGPIGIHIGSPTGSVVTTTAATIRITGTASAVAGISRVTWQTGAGAVGKAVGNELWTADGIPLLTGTNTIVLRTFDNSGNAAWASMVVVRR